MILIEETQNSKKTGIKLDPNATIRKPHDNDGYNEKQSNIRFLLAVITSIHAQLRIALNILDRKLNPENLSDMNN